MWAGAGDGASWQAAQNRCGGCRQRTVTRTTGAATGDFTRCTSRPAAAAPAAATTLAAERVAYISRWLWWEVLGTDLTKLIPDLLLPRSGVCM